MKRRQSMMTAALSALALVAGLAASPDAFAQTKLRVFSGRTSAPT
jgi:hypothetical protein